MKLQVNKVKVMILTGIAALVLMAAGIIYYLSCPSSIIAIDVNPSIELHTNRLGEVLSVDPVNEDAAKLLDGYQLTDKNLGTVIQNIVDRMISNGYLVDEKTNAILVTTDENTNSDDLMNQVDTTLNAYLQEKQLAVDVLNQKTDMDQEHVQAAHNNHVSVGKMAIINAMIQNDSTLTAANLSQESIKELIQYVHSKNLNLGQLIKNYKETVRNQEASATVTPAAGQDNTQTTPAAADTADINHSLGANAVIISTGDSLDNEDADESDLEDAQKGIEDQKDAAVKDEDRKASETNKADNGKQKNGKQNNTHKNDAKDDNDQQDVSADNGASGTDTVSGATVNVNKSNLKSDINEDNDNEDSDQEDDADEGNEIRESDQENSYINKESAYNHHSEDNENEDGNSQGDDGEDD